MDRMKELIKIINEHNYNYYVKDNPTISDKEWDVLYDELLALEAKTGTVLPNSPTLKVGGEILSGFNKHTHKVPLYSLQKCNKFEDLEKWCNDIKKQVPNSEFLVDYKFDGLSIALGYKDGQLQYAATRGNGEIGEDVTAQVKTIRSVPLSIDFKGEIIVQGEAMMRNSVFEQYNRHSKEPLKNARNGAAGAIRNLDTKITASRNLDFFAYEISYIDGQTIEKQTEIYDFLVKNRFMTSNKECLAKNYEEVKTAIEKIDKSRKTTDFMFDGVVIKINDLTKRKVFGYTAKFPRWAIAYKFEAEEVSSKLIDCIWQVGRTGKITPLAVIEPVKLAGATVKRATLNNYSEIIRKDIKLNSFVFVRRSNEVIPEILGVAHHCEDSKDIEKIKNCPSCNSELVEVGPNLFCFNTYHCPKQIQERIEHYSSRDAMNLEGISEKTVKQLHDVLNVNSVDDLYRLTYEDFAKLEGFKDKKIKKALDCIEKSKTVELHKFIYALGILNVGKKTAKELAKIFKTFDNLKNATMEELVSIRDIGEIVAQSIIDYFTNQNNNEIINSLLSSGIKIKEAARVKEKLIGLKFVLTGTLANHTRTEITELIEKNGGSVMSGVSVNTDYVLVGENPGSKLDIAQKLGVKTLNEQEFLLLID